MDTRLPVSVNIPVTLSAKAVRFRKINQLAVNKPELVPVLGVMTTEAPCHGFRGMAQFNVCVLCQFPLLAISLHTFMTGVAREDAGCKRRPFHRKFFATFLCEG